MYKEAWDFVEEGEFEIGVSETGWRKKCIVIKSNCSGRLGDPII